MSWLTATPTFVRVALVLVLLPQSAWATGGIAINVLDYGAKGDGVADDTLAVQAAINAAAAGGATEVVLPSTRQFYSVEGLTVPGGITLRGNNKLTTSLKGRTNQGTVLIVSGAFAEIRDLHILNYGNSIGIRVAAPWVTIRDCYFDGLATGVYVDGTVYAGELTVTESRFGYGGVGFYSGGASVNTIFERNTCDHMSSCVWLQDSAAHPTEGVRIVNNRIFYSGLASQGAIHVVGCDFTYVENNMVDQGTGPGLWLESSFFCRSAHNYYSSNRSVNSSAVRIVGNCSNMTSVADQFYDSRNWGLEITGQSGNRSDGITLDAPSFRYNATAPALGDLGVDGARNVRVYHATSDTATATAVTLLSNNGVNPSLELHGGALAGSIADYSTGGTIWLRDRVSVAGNVPPSSTHARDSTVGGKPTDASGRFVANGDGWIRAWAVPHGLAATPRWLSVSPGSPDLAAPAANGLYADPADPNTDATTFRVHTGSAIPVGTNNVVVNWEARAFP